MSGESGLLSHTLETHSQMEFLLYPTEAAQNVFRDTIAFQPLREQSKKKNEKSIWSALLNLFGIVLFSWLKVRFNLKNMDSSFITFATSNLQNITVFGVDLKCHLFMK